MLTDMMGAIAFIIVFLSVLVYVDSYNISEIQALRKHLFVDSDYDWRIRPSINQSKYTEVRYFSQSLFHVLRIPFMHVEGNLS